MTGSTSIDPAKSLDAGGHLLDRYHFRVLAHKARNNRETRADVLLETSSLAEFTQFILDSLQRESRTGRSIITELARCGLALPETKEIPTEREPSPVEEKEAMCPPISAERELPPADGEEATYPVLEEKGSNPDASAESGSLLTAIPLAYDSFCGLPWGQKSYVVAQVIWIIQLSLIHLLVSTDRGIIHRTRLLLGVLILYLADTLLVFLLGLGISAMAFSSLWGRSETIESRVVRFNMALMRQIRVTMDDLKTYAISGYLRRYLTPCVSKTRAVVALTGLVAASTAAIAYYKLSRGVKYKGKAESASEVLDTREREKFGMLASVKTVVPVKLTNAWNVVQSFPSARTLHTGNLDSLFLCAMRNVRFARVHVGGLKQQTHLLGVRGNYVLINSHVFGSEDRIILDISHSPGIHIGNGGWTSLTLNKSETVSVCDDVLMFSCSSNFRDLVKHFTYGGGDGHHFNGRIGEMKVSATFRKGSIGYRHPISGEKYKIERYFDYLYPNRTAGFCGLPLAGEYGSGHVICGIHAAGIGDTGYGVHITQDMLESAMRALVSRRNVLFEASSESGVSVDNVHQFEKLGMPGKKSMVRFIPLQNLQYYGKLPGPIIINSRSQLRRSRMTESVLNLLSEMGYSDLDGMRKPLMRPVSRDGQYLNPWNIGVKKMDRQKRVLKTSVLMRIQDELVERIVSGLAARGVTKVTPLNREFAINGLDADPFFRRINAATGAGFGFGKKKEAFIPIESEEKGRLTRRSVEELDARLLRCLEVYAEGRTNKFVYTACLKDEPRSAEKVRVGKTRLFYASPLDALILSRQFLSPFYTLMVKFGDLFCTAVGTDMHREGQDIYYKLSNFSEKIIEGDYSGYDLTMPLGIGECVCGVIYRVLGRLGYNRDSLLVVQGLLTDSLFPFVDILKDLFSVPGLQPSGKYATAEDNSLRGLVMLMYAYYDQGGDEFFRDLLPLTYGDDVLVASRADWFNAMSYASFVEKEFGMGFTTASKGEVEEPFISPDVMTFLKRRFVWSDEFDMVVAPLPIQTVSKALTWVLPSAVSEADQMLSSLISMSREFAFIDAGRYPFFRSSMISILSATYNLAYAHVAKCVPTLDAHIGEFKDVGKFTFGGIEKTTSCISRDSTFSGHVSITEVVSESGSLHERTRLAEHEELTFEEKSTPLDYARMREEAFGVRDAYEAHPDYAALTPGVPLRLAIREKHISAEFRGLVTRYFDLIATMRTLRRRKRLRDPVPVAESGALQDGAVSELLIENMQDVPGDEEKKLNSGSTAPESVARTALSLDDFFSRPIEIANFAVAIGSTLNLSYNVWDLYTLEPAIRAKLRNYAFLKSTLHVRVAISGSPFHYGRVLLSYQPYADSNVPLTALRNSLLSFPGMRPLILNYLSQASGAVTMDIKANKPVEMTIPFISAKPAFRLFNTSGLVISDVTSYEDLTTAGTLFFYTINPVLSTSATPSPLRVQIYAWMTDVELGTSTATQIEVMAESGEYKDERKMGPVEAGSTAVVAVSRLAELAGYFPRLARASQMMFSRLGDYAAMMGWSRPVTIEEPMYVKNNPFMNGAHTIGYETAHRLVLDPKQELTVDCSFAGENKDALVIAEIASRPSYLTTFSWNEADVPKSVLWQCRVSPRLETTDTNGVGTTFSQPTPMSFAAAPFSVWNGTIVYKFEIVTSAFHRGKVGVLFEPNISQYSAITADLSLHKNFLAVVDLQDTPTFEVKINWAKSRMWATVENQALAVQYGSSMDVVRPEYVNGFIVVFPFTSLQSPDSSDVPVNVYVRAENLRVNYLTSTRMPIAREIRAESGVYIDSVDKKFELNKATGSLADSSVLHYGEAPLSFRSLLKRYVLGERFTLAAAASVNSHLQLIGRCYPPNGLPVGSSGWTVQPELISYLYYAFLGVKGGVRKRIHVSGLLNKSLGSDGYASVKVRNGAISSSTGTGLTLQANPSFTTLEGAVTFVPDSNGGIEFELPFYSQNLFCFSFADDLIGTNNGGEYVTYWNKRYYVGLDTTEGFSDVVIGVESAAAEDFTFMRFVGAPYHTY